MNNIEALIFELQELTELIDEKMIVFDNQKELLKVDDSIQFEHLKLSEEIDSLIRTHHFLLFKAGALTGDEKLLRDLKEINEEQLKILEII